ncbi:hypothetical protein VU04_07245 [Desulfobulbus sp. TB]|nr:hypothetical protein [Desulfobulbus sp. TB]
MLLPELLNSNNLLLSLSGLKKDHAFEELKSDILARTTSALLHVIHINQTSRECTNEFNLFESQLNIKDSKIVYSSMTLGFLLNEISPLLSTLRMLQNILLKLISSIEGISLPSSINDYIKKRKKFRISDEAARILLEYWESTGLQLKLYRDIDQHFGALTQRYFMRTKPVSKILIQFPDNPEVKSLKRFSYKNNINGIEFLENAFTDLAATFDKLAELYGAKSEPHNMSISFAQLGELTPPTDRTLSFSYEKSFSNVGGGVQMNISGWGADQLPDMRLSFRKYELDKEGLAKASEMYQAKIDK